MLFVVVLHIITIFVSAVFSVELGTLEEILNDDDIESNDRLFEEVLQRRSMLVCPADTIFYGDKCARCLPNTVGEQEYRVVQECNPVTKYYSICTDIMVLRNSSKLQFNNQCSAMQYCDEEELICKDKKDHPDILKQCDSDSNCSGGLSCVGGRCRVIDPSRSVTGSGGWEGISFESEEIFVQDLSTAGTAESVGLTIHPTVIIDIVCSLVLVVLSCVSIPLFLVK